MKNELWMIGSTSFSFIDEGNKEYLKRIKHFVNFELRVIPDIKHAKNMTNELIKSKEGQEVLKKLQSSDWLILLDENGKKYTSKQFSKHLEQLFIRSPKRLIFLIGGAFGFSDEIYARANEKLSLSNMTFSHQMIRLFFLEQFYRALTIQKNLPYHHA